ncbi:hypothetical protein ZOSMA_148G00400 [Zostera marina]|uniref:Uncharacterized protein n=1 Tax=Zostera marina TaxID=29655 RepID=A0A0K9PWT4_ZOSMR|nr:hypothetical protein ZOSMA_148G00400 [Zostera marina]
MGTLMKPRCMDTGGWIIVIIMSYISGVHLDKYYKLRWCMFIINNNVLESY